MNLLQETLGCLEENNKCEADVVWVGCADYKITWENFKRVANVGYYDWFGGTEVAEDLVVVGKDFWLERAEYDGSEWWEYRAFPEEPRDVKQVATVINEGKCMYNYGGKEIVSFHKVGDKVYCCGGEVYGEIEKDNEDGTYDIVFDMGGGGGRLTADMKDIEVERN